MQADTRTIPDDLPPLPQSSGYLWLREGKAVNSFHFPGECEQPREQWDADGYWSSKGYDRAPLFTADQMREYAILARSTARAPVDTLHAAIMNLSERPGDESAYTLSERIAYKKGHKAARHAAAELVAASAQEAAPQQGEWRPIESAPKDGKTVLIAEDGYVDCGFWHDGSECYGHRGGAGWFSEDNRHGLLTARNIHPTHWMPLPLPPASLQQHDQQEGA